ncbi:MAG TPA: hypothetical protein VGR67_12645 [Candidatus Polarisedimenticolia bacterium]|nr:hypothetical protein [Candidatus Polarisedimenticolia bacterium]
MTRLFPRTLALLAAFLACGSFSPVFSLEAEPTEMALLPSSSDLVISLDYATLRKSELVSDMESRLDAVPEAAENYRRFVKETGLDPRQDTDQILVSIKNAEGSDDGFLLVARGRFAGNRLVDSAAAKGGTLSTLKGGVRMWTSPQEGSGSAGRTPMAMAQPTESMLLFGSEPEVQRAVGVVTRTKSPAAREMRFRNLLAGVDRKAPAWAVLSSKSLAERFSSEIAKGGDGPKAFAAVDSVRVMAWLGKEVDLKIQVDARDKESAGLLGDLFRGMAAAGKLAAKDSDPEALKALQEMSIVDTGAGVEIKMRIPGARLRAPQAGGRTE